MKRKIGKNGLKRFIEDGGLGGSVEGGFGPPSSYFDSKSQKHNYDECLKADCPICFPEKILGSK